MRDVLAHGYFGISLKVVWDAATTQMAELERAVRALIDDEIPSQRTMIHPARPGSRSRAVRRPRGPSSGLRRRPRGCRPPRGGSAGAAAKPPS
ncbi:MAG: DUF86 domain-containing protein [Proteobacteria bacterium]|nr:DUF86 domain-containing protein [Pseudomonadota bacterium]